MNEVIASADIARLKDIASQIQGKDGSLSKIAGMQQENIGKIRQRFSEEMMAEAWRRVDKGWDSFMQVTPYLLQGDEQTNEVLKAAKSFAEVHREEEKKEQTNEASSNRTESSNIQRITEEKVGSNEAIFPEDVLKELRSTGAFYEDVLKDAENLIINEYGELDYELFSKVVREAIGKTLKDYYAKGSEKKLAMLRFSTRVKDQKQEFPVFAMSYASEELSEDGKKSKLKQGHCLVVYDRESNKLYLGKTKKVSEGSVSIGAHLRDGMEEKSIFFTRGDAIADDAKNFFQHPEEYGFKFLKVQVAKVSLTSEVTQSYKEYLSDSDE